MTFEFCRQAFRSGVSLCRSCVMGACFIVLVTMIASAPPALGGQPFGGDVQDARADGRRAETPFSVGPWHKLDSVHPDVLAGFPAVRPASGQAVLLDIRAMEAALAAAPLAGQMLAVRLSPVIIALPRPDGLWERFAVAESPVMAAELQARFPFIRTYIGQGLDDPTASLVVKHSHRGLAARILRASPDGSAQFSSWYIDPITRGDVHHYTSYWRGAIPSQPWKCLTECGHVAPIDWGVRETGDSTVKLRLLEIAVATTGEYTAAVSAPNPANVADGLASVVDAVGTVNQLLRRDVAVQFMLVNNNDQIIHLQPGNPYSGSAEDMINQNQDRINSVIGSANYDIGHLFHWQASGISGLAALGSVCNNSQKARGISSTSTDAGTYFWFDLLSHEIGHQLGATHTFNGSACGTNHWVGATAYEPGSGSTVMAYGGICGSDNIVSPDPPHGASIPMYNASALHQIRTKLGSVGCGWEVDTGNTPPSASTNPGPYLLPTRTPFILTGSGSDPDPGQVLTYSWEQLDRSLSPRPLWWDTGYNEPLVRVLAPMATGERFVPQFRLPMLADSVPLFARTSVYRITVRDNNSQGGGTSFADTTLHFVAVPGDGFRITAPTEGTFCGGDVIAVNWDVASTNVPPINTDFVDITLSLDGGETWPYGLASNANNSGTALVALPAVYVQQARIRIDPVGSIYYNVNNGNLEIHSEVPTVAQQPQNTSVCPGVRPVLVGTVVGGMPRNIQWYKDGVPIDDDGPLPGVPNSTHIEIPVANNNHSGDYHFVVSNACGGQASNTVRLQVGVTFDQHPVSQNAQPCSTVQFSVQARGVGALSYQWQKDGQPLQPQPNISGINSPTLTIQGVRYEDEGLYRCAVTDSCQTRYTDSGSLTLPTPEWVQRATDGPTQRSYTSAMAYDERRGVSVVFGGHAILPNGLMGLANDTWEWDGVEWTLRDPPVKPPVRSNLRLVYDSWRERVLLIGQSSWLNDVWSWDGDTWVQLLPSATGPGLPPLHIGNVAFDRQRGKVMALFSPTGGAQSELWELDSQTLAWQLIQSWAFAHPWWPDATFVYDELRNRTYFQSNANWGPPQTHIYDGTTLALTAHISPARQDPSAAWDAVRERFTIYSCCRKTCCSYDIDTWAYNGAAWSQILPDDPTIPWNLRVVPSWMAFDKQRRAMVMSGYGYNNPHHPFVETHEYRYLDRIHIDRQPADLPLTPGHTAVFRIHAAGAGTLTYQWRKDNTALANGPQPSGSIISGAGTHTLTIENPSAADAGSYQCIVSNTCGAVLSAPAQLGSPCYANCDGSTKPPILTVDDFTCFINAFAQAQSLPHEEQILHYANCDGSTVAPVLNVDDFTCFINAFAAGCP